MAVGCVALCALAMLAVTLGTCSSVLGAQAGEACGAPGIARYNLTLQTLWSKRRFPKDYPLYRPAAQFSKLVGECHPSKLGLDCYCFPYKV